MSIFVVPEAPDDEKFRVFVVCFTAFAHQANIGPSAIAQGCMFGHFLLKFLSFLRCVNLGLDRHCCRLLFCRPGDDCYRITILFSLSLQKTDIWFGSLGTKDPRILNPVTEDPQSQG